MCRDWCAIQEQGQMHSLEVYRCIAYEIYQQRISKSRAYKYNVRAKVAEVDRGPRFESSCHLLRGICWVHRRSQVSVWELPSEFWIIHRSSRTMVIRRKGYECCVDRWRVTIKPVNLFCTRFWELRTMCNSYYQQAQCNVALERGLANKPLEQRHPPQCNSRNTVFEPDRQRCRCFERTTETSAFVVGSNRLRIDTSPRRRPRECTQHLHLSPKEH